MITINNKLKERFCKDCNVPITVFEDPCFSSRIELLDPIYDTICKWITFVESLKNYSSANDYLDEYNRVKDAAITSIKSSEGYKRFNEATTDHWDACNKHPSTSVFNAKNEGKLFMSIDMKHANFNALRTYDSSMFYVGNSKPRTWEQFIENFTSNPHIIKSKYIRQVILGNCNPKRHIKYEKFLMDNVLSKLYEVVEAPVHSFTNDEIIFNLEEYSYSQAFDIAKAVSTVCEQFEFPLSVELYKLRVLYEASEPGFCKDILFPEEKIELKCVNPTFVPAIMRKLRNEHITDMDKLFYFNGLLAKYEELPNITYKESI